MFRMLLTKTTAWQEVRLEDALRPPCTGDLQPNSLAHQRTAFRVGVTRRYVTEYKASGIQFLTTLVESLEVKIAS